MTHCRMCSQRLTRSGKLCRECERELERARLADASVGDLALAAPYLEEPGRVAESPPDAASSTRLRTPVVLAAFSIGLASAAAMYVAQRAASPPSIDSVMLDRDVSAVKPRVFVPKRERVDSPVPSTTAPRGLARARAVTLVTAAKPDVEHSFDRVLALSDALARCERETFFDRIACEQRARTQYCDGAPTQLPQCVDDMPRDHGQ